MKTRPETTAKKEDIRYNLPDVTANMSYDLLAGVLAGAAMGNDVNISEANEARGTQIDKCLEGLIEKARKGDIDGVNHEFQYLIKNNPLLIMLENLARVQTQRYHQQPVNMTRLVPFSYYLKKWHIEKICKSAWENELVDKTIKSYKKGIDFNSPEALQRLISHTQNRVLAKQLEMEKPHSPHLFSSLFKKPAEQKINQTDADVTQTIVCKN